MAQYQIKVSPTDGERRLIEWLCKEWGDRSAADLVLYGFRRSLESLMQECLLKRQVMGEDPHGLKALVIRLAVGDEVSDEELILLSHDAEIEISVLKRLRDCLASKEGNTNVHKG